DGGGATPSAPTGVTAAPGIRTAHVEWIAPASPGSSAITQYKVSAMPYAPEVLVQAPAKSVDVPNLQNRTQYVFSVSASNAQAEGAVGVVGAAVVRLRQRWALRCVWFARPTMRFSVSPSRPSAVPERQTRASGGRCPLAPGCEGRSPSRTHGPG